VGHFAYTGIDARGRTVRGTVDADDVKGVRQVLRKQGVIDTGKPLAEGVRDADNPKALRASAPARRRRLLTSAGGAFVLKERAEARTARSTSWRRSRGPHHATWP
jgi:hypothetical protein